MHMKMKEVTEWSYTVYLKALHDDNLYIKNILKDEWGKFVGEYNKEQEGSENNAWKLINELDHWMTYSKPIKASIRFENMRRHNNIILFWTLILWKPLKEWNKKEKLKS